MYTQKGDIKPNTDVNYLIEKYKIENYTTLELTEMTEHNSQDLDV